MVENISSNQKINVLLMGLNVKFAGKRITAPEVVVQSGNREACHSIEEHHEVVSTIGIPKVWQ